VAEKQSLAPSRSDGTIAAMPDVLRGILLMCAGVALFPLMNASVKLLTARYPVIEITWARFTGHLIVMLIVFLPQYGWRLIATRRPLVQLARSLLMLVSNGIFVLAIGSVPLATASAIGFTSPLIVTALSVPLLREQVSGVAAVERGLRGVLRRAADHPAGLGVSRPGGPAAARIVGGLCAI